MRRLGYCNPPTPGLDWPRIWWCPTGILALLPVHASGYHRRSNPGRSVLERVISSYTSTVRVLKFSRENAKQTNPGIAFIAAVPSSVGSHGRRLKTAIREALGVSNVLRDMGERNVEVHRKVCEQLPGASIAHFSCHAILDAQNPSASGLIFANGTMTVSQISQIRLRSGALAYLSACSTANSGLAGLEDEVITLSTAFQLAGFARVIGTAWNAVDRIAHNVAVSFYQHLKNDIGNAALALHLSVMEEREADRLRPSLWAAFVYTGA